ncbi:MAG: hypothetical protein ABI417_16245 [Coleofasciculaceae cyanobacterium]
MPISSPIAFASTLREIPNPAKATALSKRGIFRPLSHTDAPP